MLFSVHHFLVLIGSSLFNVCCNTFMLICSLIRVTLRCYANKHVNPTNTAQRRCLLAVDVCMCLCLLASINVVVSMLIIEPKIHLNLDDSSTAVLSSFSVFERKSSLVVSVCAKDSFGKARQQFLSTFIQMNFTLTFWPLNTQMCHTNLNLVHKK